MTLKADATQTDASGQEPRQPPRPLVAGNWKMNGCKEALKEATAIADALSGAARKPAADVMICPPATLLMAMSQLIENPAISFGAQDCHTAESGAHTGDISASMQKDAGAAAVIVGHSERREDHNETDELVCAKARAVHDAGLIAIVCIGETAGQRRVGLTLDIIARQLARSVPDGATPLNTIIAYEPVWAIGTGLVPTTQDVASVHATIRTSLEKRFADAGHGFRILYGGSVKPDNAAELMAVPNVDGALVGGASLKAVDFLGIIGVYAD